MTRTKQAMMFGCATLVAAGCAAGQMANRGSVQEHGTAAQANLRLAHEHDVAAADAWPCADAPEPYEICWTDGGTQAGHSRSAQRHRRLAQGHSAAASALRAAEDEACEGVAAADRETSPFLQTRDIQTVEMLDGGQAASETEIPVARFTFKPVGNLDAPALQRVVRCHLARNAALGHDVPEMDWCPLVPAGVAATVANVDGQLQVTLSAGEMSVGEVRRRINVMAGTI